MHAENPPPGARPVLSRLADYLKTQQQAVTDQWLLAVRRDPEIETADRLTHRQLVDHMPQLFDELCAFLRRRDAAVLREVKEDAQEHGGHRWKSGYEIEEVLREMDAFRHVITTAVARFGKLDEEFKGTAESTAAALIHQFFSEVTVNSVKQFVGEQQSLVSNYTGRLEAANVELGRSNAGLERALGERQRLTTLVTHELRNFLQGLSYANKVWNTHGSGSAEHVHAQVQVQDIQALLQQLLDHSLAIAEPKALAITHFDLSLLHQELLEEFRPLAAGKGLQLSGECSAPAPVASDRQKVRELAATLLGNALRFTPAGAVSLDFAVHGAQRWRLRVTDSGPGIGAADCEGLFGRELLAADGAPGRGMGLAMAKDMVQQLGGSIQVVSRAGSGTRFDVLLPVSCVPAEPGT